METQKYKVYIGQIQKLPKVEFSYCAVNSKYMLVFSQEAVKGFQEVPQEKENRLTKEERKWLFDCKKKVTAQYMKEHEQEASEIFMEFLDKYEEELKKEKEKRQSEKKTIEVKQNVERKEETTRGENGE